MLCGFAVLLFMDESVLVAACAPMQCTQPVFAKYCLVLDLPDKPQHMCRCNVIVGFGYGAVHVCPLHSARRAVRMSIRVAGAGMRLLCITHPLLFVGLVWFVMFGSGSETPAT